MKKQRHLPEPTTNSKPSLTKPVADDSFMPARRRPSLPTLGQLGLSRFIPYLMNRISGRWNADLQISLEREGITTTKMRALAVLSVMSPTTMSELALHAVTEQSTMSRTIDAMVRQGLVRRNTSTTDQRLREIRISEQGRELFGTIWPMMHMKHQRMFVGLDETQIQTFITCLHRILQNMEEDAAEPPST